MHGTFDKPMLVQGYLLPWLTKHKVFKKNNGKTHETNKITRTFRLPQERRKITLVTEFQ